MYLKKLRIVTSGTAMAHWPHFKVPKLTIYCRQDSAEKGKM